MLESEHLMLDSDLELPSMLAQLGHGRIEPEEQPDEEAAQGRSGGGGGGGGMLRRSGEVLWLIEPAYYNFTTCACDEVRAATVLPQSPKPCHSRLPNPFQATATRHPPLSLCRATLRLLQKSALVRAR